VAFILFQFISVSLNTIVLKLFADNLLLPCKILAPIQGFSAFFVCEL